MKKIMIATLGLSLLSGTAVFAQNTSSGSDTMKSTHSKKKSKKKGSDTTSTTSTSTSK